MSQIKEFYDMYLATFRKCRYITLYFKEIRKYTIFSNECIRNSNIFMRNYPGNVTYALL